MTYNNNNNNNRNNNNNQNNNRNNNNDNGLPFNRQNNIPNYNPFKSNPSQVNLAEIKNPFEVYLLSLPSTKPYDIIPDLWNAPVNTTIRSFISGRQTNYFLNVITALNSNRNRILDVQITKPISTTAMKMKIRVKDQLVIAILDTGAMISIISFFLVDQLGLEILPILT